MAALLLLHGCNLPADAVEAILQEAGCFALLCKRLVLPNRIAEDAEQKTGYKTDKCFVSRLERSELIKEKTRLDAGCGKPER